MMMNVLRVLAGLCLIAMGVHAAPHEIPPAYGHYLHPGSNDFIGGKSFTSRDRMVGTYYFYWYDAPSQTHVINTREGTDALTDHPPTLNDFSWKSVTWHRKQLLDMETAGIDVALMVFWGAPSEHAPEAGLHWSFEGLPPLVHARDQLVAEGHHPPAIGLFYDTSTLANNAWHEHIDLTTDYGRRWFYATVRDFYSCIPAKDWAMMDGKPIMLMYAAAFAAKYDQSFIDYAHVEFPKDFGGRQLYIAPQNSWNVQADSECLWGGALGEQRGPICELGPGYDHSAVPGRAPLVAARRGGKFYEENWIKFLRHPSNFVMLETWNEFHEGTDICESREYGRTYIDLTTKYTRLFKQGWTPPPPSGKYHGAHTVSATFGATNQSNGLRIVAVEDGLVLTNESGLVPNGAGSKFMYFTIDDSFKWPEGMTATLDVEYLDAGAGSLSAEYDGNDLNAPYKGAYTGSGNSVDLHNSGKWKTAHFKLSHARFLNSENGDADFRLVVLAPELCVRRVVLTRN